MSNPLLIQIVGIFAGILTTISMLPQLIKMIREKKTDDVSLIMLMILLAGISLWIVYGFLKEDIPILASNGISLLINIILIVLRIKYQKSGKKIS